MVSLDLMELNSKVAILATNLVAVVVATGAAVAAAITALAAADLVIGTV